MPLSQQELASFNEAIKSLKPVTPEKINLDFLTHGFLIAKWLVPDSQRVFYKPSGRGQTSLEIKQINYIGKVEYDKACPPICELISKNGEKRIYYLPTVQPDQQTAMDKIAVVANCVFRNGEIEQLFKQLELDTQHSLLESLMHDWDNNTYAESVSRITQNLESHINSSRDNGMTVPKVFIITGCRDGKELLHIQEILVKKFPEMFTAGVDSFSKNIKQTLVTLDYADPDFDLSQITLTGKEKFIWVQGELCDLGQHVKDIIDKVRDVSHDSLNKQDILEPYVINFIPGIFTRDKNLTTLDTLKILQQIFFFSDLVITFSLTPLLTNRRMLKAIGYEIEPNYTQDVPVSANQTAPLSSALHDPIFFLCAPILEEQRLSKTGQPVECDEQRAQFVIKRSSREWDEKTIDVSMGASPLRDLTLIKVYDNERFKACERLDLSYCFIWDYAIDDLERLIERLNEMPRLKDIVLSQGEQTSYQALSDKLNGKSHMLVDFFTNKGIYLRNSINETSNISEIPKLSQARCRRLGLLTADHLKRSGLDFDVHSDIQNQPAEKAPRQ